MKKQILVVEDEGIVADDIRHRVERLGYSVPAVAASGQEALDCSRQQPFDLVLMDIHLQGPMDGIETAQALRRDRDVPVVYLTAYADSKTVARAGRSEASGYLVKPVRDGALRAAIEMSLRRHESEHRTAVSLEHTREKCHTLSRQLHTAKESECRRLARELHDDIQQRLTALALELEIHERTGGWSPETTTLMQSTCLRVRQIARDLRQLAHHLHPRILEEQGLLPALMRLCQGYTSRGFQVQLQPVATLPAVPPDVALCLYRVTQESLENAAKYSGAKGAEVSLEGGPSRVELRITDHGAGFDVAAVQQGSPIGLSNMQARAEDAGGTLSIVSQPGQGTEVTLYVPLEEVTP